MNDPMVPRHRLNGCRSILQDRFKIQSSLVENYQSLMPEKALKQDCMQLVAYGAQDVYLTGNPQITST